MSRPTYTLADIRTYYDRNTPAFLRLGQGGGNIHRAVWGPGVAGRDDAFQYVHELIAARIRQVASPTRPTFILDLGCGVGASLCDLACKTPVQGVGITISGVQAQFARKRIAAAGLSERLSCIEGDYTALPSSIRDVDLAYAIESFVHGPAPEQFFKEAARVTRTDGFLIICDDVRRPSDHPRAREVVERFTRGWHVNSLETGERLREMAAVAGFGHEDTINLTPYLELGRARDHMITLLARIAGALPFRSTRLAPLLGGAALQEGLQRGWLAYEFMVFRRMRT